MSTPIYRGRVIDVVLEHCLLPNGHEVDLEIIRHPGGAAAVALNASSHVGLIYQYRHAAGGWIWELPAGRIDLGEEPLQTAQRELIEEIGMEAMQWQPLGFSYSSPGVFNEVIHLYLATELEPRSQALGADEVLEVYWVPLTEALQWAVSGKINDSKTIIGLFRAAAILHIAIPNALMGDLPTSPSLINPVPSAILKHQHHLWAANLC